MKKKELSEILIRAGLSVTLYQKKNTSNKFTIKQSFSFHHGQTEADLEGKVCKALTKAKVKFEIYDCGEQWSNLYHGVKIGEPESSYWWVIVEIQE